jgi:hypothetical protein
MANAFGRAVLEISTDSTSFFSDLDKAEARGKRLEVSFKSIGDGLASAFARSAKSIAESAAGFFTAEAAYDGLKQVAHLLADELETLSVKGAKVAAVEESFAHLTAGAGLLGGELLGTLRNGTRSTIDDFELMKSVNQDLAAGMTLTDQQFGVLAKGAYALARATGTDVKSAFDTMNDAMLTGRGRAIALLTGKIDLAGAEELYARKLGGTAAELTSEGKLEADRQAILKAVGAATERLGEQTEGLDTIIEQGKTAWANFHDELAKTVATSPVIMAGLAGIRDAVRDAVGDKQADLVRALASAIDSAAIEVVELAREAALTAPFFVRSWYAVESVFINLAQAIDDTRLALVLVQRAGALGILPGTADLTRFRELTAEANKLYDTIVARKKSLDELDTKKAALKTGLDPAIAELDKRLAAIRDRMQSAKDAAAAFVGPLQDVGAAATNAGDASRRGAAQLQASEGDLKAAREQLKAATLAAAKAEAVAEAEGFQQRIVAAEEEHATRLALIRDEPKAVEAKNLEIQAENIRFTAESRTLQIEGQRKLRDDLLSIQASTAQAIAQANETGLQLRLSQLRIQEDQAVIAAQKEYGANELAAQKIAAVRREYENQADAAIAQERRQTDEQIAAIETQIETARLQATERGLAGRLDAIDTETRAQIDALSKQGLRYKDFWDQAQERLKKAASDKQNLLLENDRQIADEQFSIETERQKEIIGLTMQGVQAELALNELELADKRRQLDLDLQSYKEVYAKKLAILEAFLAVGDTEAAAQIQPQLDALKQLIAGTESTLSQIEALYGIKAQAIIGKFDPVRQAWLALNTDLRQEWANTWAQALKTHQGWVEALLSPFQKLEDEWLNLLGALIADWEGQFLAKLGFNIPGVTGGAGGIFGSGPSGPGGVVMSLLGGGGRGGGGFVGPTLEEASPDFVGPTLEQAGGPAGLNAGSLAKGAIGAFGLMEAGRALQDKGKNLGEDLAAGISIGFSVGGPVGAAIGAAAGFVAKGLSMLFGGPSQAELEGRKVAEDFEKGLAESLTATQRLAIGNNRVAQSLAALQNKYTAIGLTADEAARRAAGDMNAIWAAEKLGADKVKAVQDQINARFEGMKQIEQALANLKPGKFLSEDLQQFVDTQIASGQQTQAVTDFLLKQAEVATGAFNGMTSALDEQLKGSELAGEGWDDLKKRVDDATEALKKAKTEGNASAIRTASDQLTAALKDQKTAAAAAAGQLEDLSVIALATFETERAAGKTRAEALAAAQPGLQRLAQAYKDLGLEIEDAELKQLVIESQVLAKNPALVQGISALGQSTAALSNSKKLTVESFAAIERTGVSMYTRLQAEVAKTGGDTKAALEPMQDYLHQAEEAAKRLGVPLDANTQMLIDQSKELGVWQEQASPVETLTDDVKQLVKSINDLVNQMRGIPPEVNSKITIDEETRKRTTTVKEGEGLGAGAGAGAGGEGGEGAQGPGAATGGLVTTTGVAKPPTRYMRTGGFVPRGSDTVPALVRGGGLVGLTPGELIVPTEYAALVAAFLRAIHAPVSPTAAVNLAAASSPTGAGDTSAASAFATSLADSLARSFDRDFGRSPKVAGGLLEPAPAGDVAGPAQNTADPSVVAVLRGMIGAAKAPDLPVASGALAKSLADSLDRVFDRDFGRLPKLPAGADLTGSAAVPSLSALFTGGLPGAADLSSAKSALASGLAGLMPGGASVSRISNAFADSLANALAVQFDRDFGRQAIGPAAPAAGQREPGLAATDQTMKAPSDLMDALTALTKQVSELPAQTAKSTEAPALVAKIAGLEQEIDTLPEETAADTHADASTRFLETMVARLGEIGTAIRTIQWPGGGPGGTSGLPSYRFGTEGFLNFGRGTLAMLHGREAVIPESAAGSSNAAESRRPAVVVNQNLTLNVDGVLNEGGLEKVVERKVVPMIHKAYERVGSLRTAGRQALWIEK